MIPRGTRHGSAVPGIAQPHVFQVLIRSTTANSTEPVRSRPAPRRSRPPPPEWACRGATVPGRPKPATRARRPGRAAPAACRWRCSARRCPRNPASARPRRSSSRRWDTAGRTTPETCRAAAPVAGECLGLVNSASKPLPHPTARRARAQARSNPTDSVRKAGLFGTCLSLPR